MSLAQIKKDIREWLDEEDGRLLCTDFKGAVKIVHGDGSVFLIENVILKQEKFGDFDILLVWTEHCGSFFFFTEDLEKWYYYPYETIRDSRETCRTCGHPLHDPPSEASGGQEAS